MAKTIKREELKRKLDRQEEFVLIEVLSEREYQRAHIKGAINVPFGQIGHQARERLDPEQMIVVYCADRQCQASPIAAQKLEQAGFGDVWEYPGGKQDWQQAGVPDGKQPRRRWGSRELPQGGPAGRGELTVAVRGIDPYSPTPPPVPYGFVRLPPEVPVRDRHVDAAPEQSAGSRAGEDRPARPAPLEDEQGGWIDTYG